MKIGDDMFKFIRSKLSYLKNPSLYQYKPAHSSTNAELLSKNLTETLQ